MSADPESIGRFWRGFADHSLRDYSPLYDRIAREMADDPEVMAFVAAAPVEAHSPNNLQAAVHYLLLAGLDHPLGAVYRGEVDADPAPLFREVVMDHREMIAALLATRVVQTNEVARTAATAPALRHAADILGEPVALADIGCSAGLTLLVDRFRIDLGGLVAGPPDARLQIRADQRGATADPTCPEIVWRRGYDRAPVDVTDPDAARWLRALVWPDHPERGDVLRLAIEEAIDDPPPLEQADCLTALERALTEAPDNATLVVTTTWVFYYFDDETRAAFEAMIVGASRPVAWVSMEMAGLVPGLDPGPRPDGPGEASVIGLVLGGVDEPRRALGWANAHGAWVDWRT